MNREFTHTTVLLQPAIERLMVDSTGVYIDGTFGRGGHSRELLEKLGEAGRVFGIDRDPVAADTGQKLAAEDSRFKMSRESFARLGAFAEQHGLTGRVSGILLDLGVSSPQLDDVSRGFSFLQDGPLDMRMDPERGQSAGAWLAGAKEKDIADVLKTFGEERYARRIARAIVTARAEHPIETTGQLAAIVKQANPNWERDKHPATRAFQGIRIFINGELSALQEALNDSLEVLRIGGRLVVISFHSLEDKIVKNFMSLQTKGDNFPRDLPVLYNDLHPTLKLIGKPIRPDEDEIRVNPRSRSAIMRVAERIA